MRRNWMQLTLARFTWLIGWCWLVMGAPAVEMDGEAVRVSLESIAKTNTYFPLPSVVRNQALSIRVFPRNEEVLKIEANAKNLSVALRAVQENRTALAALLEHPDPKVRTLAVGALFLREDKQDLPLIASLLDDDAPTFSNLRDPYMSNLPTLADYIAPLTVEEVAKAMLEAAGMPSRSMAEFKGQWQKYEGRPQSAKWFQFKLERANRRTSPDQKEYQTDIQRVIAEMEALPLPERGWTRLYVLSARRDSEDKTISDDYLVAAARELGPEVLLRFLLGEKVTEDPDVRLTKEDDYHTGSMRRVILLHADQLLRAEQFDVLLANARAASTSRYVAPFWLAGAALVRPDRASELLRGAMTAKMPGSGLLASVLWRMRGKEEIGFLADWFYSRNQNQGFVGFYVSFLGEVRTLARKETPELMKALIRHEGFRLTNWGQLDEMLTIAGDQHGARLIDRREIYDAWQREDGDLKGALAEWRNLLRREYGLATEALPLSFLKAKRIVTTPKWSQELPGDATCVTISPDAKSVAVLTNGTVTVWNTAAGTLEWQVPRVMTEGVIAMAFQPEGNRLTILDRAKYGRFIDWDLTTRQPGKEVSLTGKPSGGLDQSNYSFDAAAQRLSVARFQHAICFDVTTGKPLWSKENGEDSRFVVLSPDGKRLATQGEGGLNVWDTTSGELVRKLDNYAGDIMTCAFSRDAKMLATVSLADGIRVVNLTTGKTLLEYSYPVPHWGEGSLLFSPDGKRLAVLGTDGLKGLKRVAIFRTDKRELEVEFQQQGQRTDSAQRPMVFAPDGKTLYTVMGRLEAWSLSP